jgi:superfamily II DNA or RNA helicase
MSKPVKHKGAVSEPDAKRKKKLTKLKAVSKWTALKRLWVHQRKAIKFLEKYLRHPEANKHAALVRMPTGTGKTGIMAVLANYLAPGANVLIVVPSSYLTFQLSEAIQTDFWCRIEAQPVAGPKRAFSFRPNILTAKLESHFDPSVFVCTTVTLQMLYASYREHSSDEKTDDIWTVAYRQLLQMIDIVLVDEGHREPAKEWARAVREFHKPTILFSATPYRNDLRFFKVGRKKDLYRHEFRFQNAIAGPKPIIRDVRFISTSQSYTHPPENDEWNDKKLKAAATLFAKLLVREFYNKEVLSNVPPDVKVPRVIVRCQTGASVSAVKQAIERELSRDKKLEKPKEKVLAVHDDFKKNPESNEYGDVPRRDELGKAYPDQAIYWVHQFKLTEGLDDNEFCAIAFFQRFKNSRALVQQIGRILRNPSEASVPALVLHDPTHDIQDEFDAYRQFEKSRKSIVGPEEIVYAITDSLPDWFYFERRYRKGLRYDIGEDEQDTQDVREVMKGVQIKKSALVFRSLPPEEDKKLQELLEEYSESLEEYDQIQMLPWYIDRSSEDVVAVALHCRIEQTPFLHDRAFFEISLVPTIFCWNRGFLFLQGRTICMPLDLAEKAASIEPNVLEVLLPASTRMTQVSLINCDLARASVRRRAIAAYALDEVAAGLGDHFHFTSSAVGSLQRENREFRRYLGFHRARVTEPEEQKCGVQEFRKWAEGLATELHRPPNDVNKVLNRFAQYVRPDKEEKARHILIEFNEFFRVYHSGLFPETFNSLAADVSPIDQSFSCEVGGSTLRGTVEFKKGRFRLISDDLDKIEPLSDEVRTKPTTFLSQKSSFRIVTENGKLFSNGRFYCPRQPLWEGGRLEDLALFHHVESLGRITNREKGRERFGRKDDGSYTWQKKSVFYVIDNDPMLWEAAKFTPDLLICEDLGTEIADFVALDFKQKRMCVIHAKAYGSKDHFSPGASPFHDVYAQVVKNLEYLSPFGTVAADRKEKWTRLWNPWGNKPRIGIPRIRRKPEGLKDIAAITQKVIEFMHSTETQKEVWVVLGNGFPIQDLLVEGIKTGKLPHKYHCIQLIYLLQSCSSQVSSVGARLRIFSIDHAKKGGRAKRNRR